MQADVHTFADVRLGTCAWSFDDWRGAFYPEGLASNQRLAFYARHFRAVEIDSTFYAAPSVQTARHWHESTPDDFLFTCKVPREITHVRKLRGSTELLASFLAGIAPLEPKLGCVLIQLPPWFNVRQDERALREFIGALPRGVRFAVEFRDPGWHLPRIAHLLEEHHVCWVWNDVTSLERQDEGAFGFFPQTSDFLYVRLIGDLATKGRRDGGRVFRYRRLLWPRESSLESWALKVRQQLGGVRQAFIGVNNHFEGFAPATCQRIGEWLDLPVRLPSRDETHPAPAAGGRQLELQLG